MRDNSPTEVPWQGTIVAQAAYRESERWAAWVEHQILICLRPKPRWLPKRVWRWVVCKLLTVTHEQLTQAEAIARPEPYRLRKE